MSPSSSDQKRAANAAAGKTARACDSCLRKRARWYCAADDAFLCQACDSSVHSANSLARRHERVRLKTASFKPTHRAEEDQSANSSMENKNSPPAWHQGFRRKARTPRHGKPSGTQQLASKLEQVPLLSHPIPALVPEIGSDETLHDENEEQLLYRVPIFDPFVAEFCKSETPSSTDHQAAVSFGNYNNFDSNSSPTTVNNNAANIGDDHESKDSDLENLHGLILPSDIELAEFAADVETLLGRGLDEDSIGMEGLGLLDANEYRFGGTGRVKIEEDEEEEQEEKVRRKNLVTYACHLDQDIDISRETLDLKFDCETPTTGGEEEEEKVAAAGMTKMMAKIKRGSSDKEEIMKRRVLLRLDYDAVIAAWASHGSPWTTGDRPEVNPDDLWVNNFATWATEVHQACGGGGGGGELGSGGGHMGMGDGGREARVLRYREKRRTRLFSKKIRYEVRKLNAEKRPRMKGRFVKRAPYVGGGPGFPF